MYPSQNYLAFTIDRALRKATLEFYLENTQEESASAVVVVTENQADFWTIQQWGSGSFQVAIADETTIKRRATESCKITITDDGEYSVFALRHTYSPNQDWSTKDFITFPWYGNNTGQTVIVEVRAPDQSNYWFWSFVDNFIGFKDIIIALKNPSTTGGSPTLTTVGMLSFYFGSPAVGVMYLDRVVVDVGVWAKVEIGVPDTLLAAGNINAKLYSWNGSAYATLLSFDCLTDSWGGVDSGSNAWVYALDTQTYKTIYNGSGAESYDKFAKYVQGLRGQAKTARNGGSEKPTALTYRIDYFYCKRRVGFALKMPPADGQASSTSGIGQCKLKAEVYYQ